MESNEGLFRRLEQLNEIGAALSSERDIDCLLEKILLAAKAITHADGGTLYRLTENRKALRFEIVHNDTLGIALGAFAAHGLRAVLDQAALAWWQTAVQYQMWHAIGLIALGAARLPRTLLPALLLATGTVIFASTLYAMALGGPRWLGAITPI